MKVIHLILSDVYAGMEQYVNELIAEQEKECDVILICTKNISKKFKNKNVVSIKDYSRNSPIGLFRIYFLIKKQKANLIHTHGSKTASIVNILKKFLNIKHVASAHGIKKNDKPFLKADRLICVSINVQKSINRNSIVINNWYSPILPEKINKTPEYVIAVGRLEKVKGFDLLIKSWVKVQARLMIIGSGNEFKNIDLTHLICELMYQKLELNQSSKNLIAYVTDRPGHDFRYAMNSDKIKKHLNWKSETPFKEALNKTIDYYLNQNQSKKAAYL